MACGSVDRLVIRDATVEDLPAIVRIYNHYVETSTATFDEEPQSLEQRRQWFERHGDSHPVIIAELNGVVVGWASISPFSDRPAYRLTVENSVYVHPEFTGRGVGSRLMQELISRARSLGYHCIVARIAESNEGSIRLHNRFGFRKIGTMEEVGYKFGQWLDVAIMMLSLTQSSGCSLTEATTGR